MAKLGLTFGDVVQAHVYPRGRPGNGGKMDFAGLNKAWVKEFGTAAQPNKPSRAAFQVAALAMPGALVESSLSPRRRRSSAPPVIPTQANYFNCTSPMRLPAGSVNSTKVPVGMGIFGVMTLPPDAFTFAIAASRSGTPM